MAEFIDRDTLIKKITEVQDKAMTGIEDVTYYRAKKIIREMPPADVQPVKHGQWEDCSNGWMCSCCERDNTKDTPFCPNCGARMDLKDGDTE